MKTFIIGSIFVFAVFFPIVFVPLLVITLVVSLLISPYVLNHGMGWTDHHNKLTDHTGSK